ncbi:MAG: cytochrome c [Bdellovibrionota bacterium]
MRIASLLFLVLFAGCTKSQPVSSPATPEEAQKLLESKGRAVYQSSCTSCHSNDPKVDGSLGPAVAGSSRELLEARIMTATYPAGYTPKRPSLVMVALPHLKNDIDALAAYLGSVR